ncbi:MAG: ABC transporter permease [Bryobacteraceae bacterium]
MRRTIFVHEWRNLTADRTLWVVSLLFAVLICYAVSNGARWAAFQRATIDEVLAEQSARRAKLKESLVEIETGRREPRGFLDPRSAAAIGQNTASPYAVMPPAPLASFAIGQSDLNPSYYKLGLRTKELQLAHDEIENPTHLLSGRFDLAFVLVYLYPLLILALSYNLISAEREQGTLALALSQPVSLGTIVFSKVLFRALVLIVLAAAVTTGAALLSGVALLHDGTAMRLLLWIAVVAAYGAFWFALAVAVNSFGKSSASNAIALAGLWLGFVLLIPTLLNVAAAALYPVPSRVEMIQAVRSATKEATERGSLILARYYEEHPELASASEQRGRPDFASTSYAVQEEVERLIRPLTSQFDEQIRRQQTMIDRLRYFSPAILAQEAFNDLAGSGQARYRHFQALVDEFIDTWRSYFFPRVFQRKLMTSGEIEGLPAFDFREEPEKAVAARVAVSLAGIAIPVLLIAVAATGAVRRYRPA